MSEIIKSKDRVKKYGEVYTPQWIVEKMCDDLEEENPDAFLPEKTFLEPTCGEGVFILEILRRKFSNCRKRADYTLAISTVYGMDILPDNVETTIQNVTSLCNQTFHPTKADLQTIQDHIIQADSLKIMKMMTDPKINQDILER